MIDPMPLVMVTISLRSLLRYIIDACLGDLIGPKGVDVEHACPRFVIDVSDGLTTGAANAGIIEKEVNWLALQFGSRRPDACKIADIHGQHVKLAAAPISHDRALKTPN